VDNLESNAGGCIAPWLLQWSYSNPGDLDQNSEVNISDLAVLGANLNTSASGAGWSSHCSADADGNGTVNISDLCTIGAHLGSRVDGYVVEYSSDGVSWNELGRMTLGEITPPGSYGVQTYIGGEFNFEPDLAVFNHDGSFRVRAYRDGLLGEPGAPLLIDLPDAPYGLMASQGTEPETVAMHWMNIDCFPVEIRRADAPGGDYSPLDMQLGEDYSDSTVVPGQHYWYQLWWVSDGWNGGYYTATDVEGWSGPAEP
jgi:hypothetical protein